MLIRDREQSLWFDHREVAAKIVGKKYLEEIYEEIGIGIVVMALRQFTAFNSPHEIYQFVSRTTTFRSHEEEFLETQRLATNILMYALQKHVQFRTQHPNILSSQE